MKIILFLLGFILLLVFLAILIFSIKQKKTDIAEQCKDDSDCVIGYKCSFVKEDNQNRCIPVKSLECQVFPFTELQSCRLNTSDCQKCINTPSFSCQKISWGKPKIVEGGSKYTKGIANAIDSKSNQSIEISIDEVAAENGSIIKLSVLNPNVLLKAGAKLKVIQKDNNSAQIQLQDDITFYNFNAGPNNIKSVPESKDGYGWCLPSFDPSKSEVCNTYTSTYALFKDPLKETFYWGCICKNPEFMNHRNTTSRFDSCTRNLVCPNLYVPSDTSIKCQSNDNCNKNQKCCTLSDNTGQCMSDDEKPVTDNNHYCLNPWDINSMNDPTLGSCVCGNGTFPNYLNNKVDIQKSCIVDSCANVPGGSYDKVNKRCKCPDNYYYCNLVGSKADIEDDRCNTNKAGIGIKNNGICILNPCGWNGKPDLGDSGGGCTCDTGFKKVTDNNVIGNVVCRNGCDPDPCNGRGTCTFDDNLQTTSCKDCVCPWCNKGDPYCASTGDDKYCSNQRTSKTGIDTFCFSSDECCNYCKNGFCN